MPGTAGIKSSARISDAYLNSIPADKRKEMSEALHKSIDDLESLTDKRWAYDAKDEGWSDVIDFIEEKNLKTFYKTTYEKSFFTNTL